MRLLGAEEARVQQEISAVVDALSELTGLSSRWNGDVELSQDTRIFGRKPFSCRIVLNQQLANNPIRWRTLIHEALDSFSAGYTMGNYQMFLGWEEAVVEQTQRLLRPAVLERIGVQVESSIFVPIETNYSFNKYISAMERMRVALRDDDEQQFYLNLLATEINIRHSLVFSRGNQLPKGERNKFIAVFSEANSVLKESPL